jgi:molecular chaperone DnaK
MNPTQVFGIDLGTTYSAISHVDEYGQPTVILNEDDEPVTSSTIFFETPESVIVGKVAKTSGQADPSRYCELIKPHMGSNDFRREFHGKEYRPEQLSAIILSKLKSYAQDKLNCEITDVVITVPAYFDEQQRNATEQAGILAGFTVRGIIPEPTAAAIAYAANEEEERTILVYDLGGGTFDVTVMRVERNQIRAICVKGDHNLGGRQWDDCIVAHLSAEWQRAHGDSDDPLLNRETLQELLNRAEETKKQLSQRVSVPINVSHAGKKTRVDLSREKFEELTESLLEKTLALTRNARTEAAALGAPSVDLLLMVGGSSRMPQVKSRLALEFPGVEQKLFDPELSVAKGAAIYANNTRIQELYRETSEKMFGKTPLPNDKATRERIAEEVARLIPGGNLKVVQTALDTRVINVTSKSFGLETTDPGTRRQEVSYLIKRNTPVPATKTETFATLDPNQTAVDLRIIESSAEESQSCELPRDPEHPSNHRLKTISLHLPPHLPAGHPIEVTYSVSEDGGRLQVRAVDKQSGNSIEDSVENLSAIQPREMESMRNELRRMKLD